jgi:hypothetical protein
MSAGNSNGFVRVMRSHDYNQFEVCLPIAPCPEGLTAEQFIQGVDLARKDAARLVDKAVRQYDRMKRASEMVLRLTGKDDELRQDVQKIMNIPEERRSPEQKAKVKLLSDFDHYRLVQEQGYSYDDDEPDFGDEF